MKLFILYKDLVIMFIAIAQLAVELPIAQEVVIERDN